MNGILHAGGDRRRLGAESNGFSQMDVFDGGTIRLAGFRKQAKYEWK